MVPHWVRNVCLSLKSRRPEGPGLRGVGSRGREVERAGVVHAAAENGRDAGGETRGRAGACVRAIVMEGRARGTGTILRDVERKPC